ncbi:hypothetical protein [Micromonospora sp. NBC_01813]|uniref:hypothetical protein n=1 Tax=Micromonospora sp. NBC_01813 TaxID=2975988 RepID=UPI002DD9C764|nr:hypothetical protein [Micromonospora sp. NBC_01813]WSA11389.1 hypothetical protein OG958_11745 [Micromonospora sp. NBC_01813]
MTAWEYHADGEALQVAADTISALRAVCLALEAAVTHVTEQLGDAGPLAPDARLTVDRYEDALHQAWEAYGEVHDAVAAARPHLPGSRPIGLASVLHGLRTARNQAGHATATIHDARPRLLAAADWLHRSDDRHAQRAAARLRQSLTRLDQVGASLDTGSNAVDRYLDALDTDADPPQQRRQRLARLRAIATGPGHPRPSPEVLTVAAGTAAALVTAGRAHLRFRTDWQILRQTFWDSTTRNWRL